MKALGLEPDAVRIADLHRLPQHPVTKAGKKVTQPIIVKVLTAFDKSIIYDNVNNLKAGFTPKPFRQRYRCVNRYVYVRVFTLKKSALAVTER